MAALIAFYSRADENYFGGDLRYIKVGNTQRAAEMIQEAVGGELFQIRQQEPYSADYRTCVDQARRDWQEKARPALAAFPESLEGYDDIYLGYPNYCGDMPMAVYTFLEHFDWSGKRIHPFCTHEGSGLSHTVQDIQKAAPGAVVTRGLAIHGSDVESAKAAIQKWVRETER